MELNISLYVYEPVIYPFLWKSIQVFYLIYYRVNLYIFYCNVTFPYEIDKYLSRNTLDCVNVLFLSRLCLLILAFCLQQFLLRWLPNVVFIFLSFFQHVNLNSLIQKGLSPILIYNLFTSVWTHDNTV